MQSAEFASLMKPRIFLAANSESDNRDAKRASVACACDYVEHVGLETAAAILQSGPQPDLVILNVGATGVSDGASIDAVASVVSGWHCPLLISTPLPLVDVLPASAWSHTDAVLADPTDADLAAAIAVAIGNRDTCSMT